jgi:predicted acetyltransferase
MDSGPRAVTEDELDELIRVNHAAFGHGMPDAETLADLKKVFVLDRTRAVFDGGRMVGASAAFPFELTLPGLTTVPASGVSMVGVLPTHSRRGHLRAMIGALLDDTADRGEPVSILLASESLLYGRFGFGLASTHTWVELGRRHAALLPSAPTSGRVTLVDGAEAAKVLPAVLDRARRCQPGDITRPGAWWDGLFRDPEKNRNGAGPNFYAVHESSAGEADGYAIYRIKHSWDDGSPNARLLAGEIVSLDAAAEADLWRFLCSVDLVEVIEAENRPVTDPLRWMLADPRRLVVKGLSDWLWARVLDVEGALSARRYATAGELVLEVTDPFRLGTAGRYALEGGPDGATCRRTDAAPDLTLEADALGALYLGGVGAATLAGAGRVVEHTAGAIGRAGAMFASDLEPFCRTHF